MFVVGSGISHSLSPAMWNHLFATVDPHRSYGLRDVGEDELPGVLAELRGGFVIAANVTMPHKAWAAGVADVQTPEVSATGAANFLQQRPDGLFAANTDVVGARMLLDATGSCEDAVLLGAGGTASALLEALRGRVRRLTIANRTYDRAVGMAHRAEGGFESVEVTRWADRGVATLHAGLIVNTVPITDEDPLADADPHSGTRIYDVNYRSAPTRFQERVDRLGLEAVDGLAHLAAQAIAMLPLLDVDQRHAHLLVAGLEQATDRTVTAWGRPFRETMGLI